MADKTDKNWPLYEVFLLPRNGLSHKHVGSLHAVDDEMALQNARDVYTRRGETFSIWVVPSSAMGPRAAFVRTDVPPDWPSSSRQRPQQSPARPE